MGVCHSQNASKIDESEVIEIRKGNPAREATVVMLGAGGSKQLTLLFYNFIILLFDFG